MKAKDYGVFGDVLAAGMIGSWKIELEEGKEPRMYADKTMLHLLGVPEEASMSPEQVYHAWYDHVDSAHYEAVAEGVGYMLKGQMAEIQYPWHHPDGRTIVVRCGGIRDQNYTDGARVAGIHQWVTTLKHVDRELESQQRQLKELLSLVDGLSREYHTVWKIDGDTHELMLFRNTGGTTAQESVEYWVAHPHYDSSIRWYVEKFVDVSDQERVLSAVSWEALTRNIPEHGFYSVTYKRHPVPDVTNYHQVCYAKAVNTSGKTDYVFASRDVDMMVRDQMAAEQLHRKELERALAAAEAASKSKTEFLFNMSHDIRTPLNAIKGFNEIAMNHLGNDSKVLDCLQKAGQAGDLLLTLINSVLDMSRIEAGKAKLDETKGDVLLSFVNIKSTLMELAEAKGVNLTFEFGEIWERYVYADFVRCTRVFVNIISNAIKYSKPHGYVKVRCDQIGHGLYRYVFADNGIGMSKEFLEHVYEEFARERNSTVSGIQGTGLGLALCKSFVELMGGHIECQSQQGVGTTFTVTLPFRLQEDAEYTDPHTGKVVPADAKREDNVPASVEFSGKRILLVEDNDLNREVAEDVLSGMGLEVETATDGSEAVERVREAGLESFDYILMDIQMPVMGGYEATAVLRSMGCQRPIIAFSANAFAEDKAASLAAGMDDHVAKPISIQELKTVLIRHTR